MKTLGRFALAGLAAIWTTVPDLRADTAAGESVNLAIEVTDRQGEPVGNVVVYAHRKGNGEYRPNGSPTSAVMDQLDAAFVPHILVAQTGTEISFPNQDLVSHHVYSFSEAKPFELPLYKGRAHAPLLFDTPGLVVIGCNIHDNMLGYILIVDTPHFAKTGTEGHAELELPAGEYSIHVWTPRLREKALPAAQSTALSDAEERMIAFQFTEKLFPPHAHNDGALTWTKY